MTHYPEAKRLREAGALLMPGTSGYNESKTIFNRSVEADPRYVIRPSDNSHILDALSLARSMSVPVTIRNGGHSAYGFSVGNDCIVIDMRLMGGMRIDKEGSTIHVEAGALSGQLDDFMAPYQVAIPLGDCPGVGIAGIALGGGNGFISRKYGLTCDRLSACTLVTAEGELLRINDDSHSDLMWAMRGGGQCNFGVVTEMEFETCPVPSEVVVGSVFFELEDAVVILPHLIEMLNHAPDELSLFIRMNREPGRPALRIYGVYLGSPNEGLTYFSKIEQWARVISSDIRTCTYRDAQKINASSVVEGVSFHWQNAMIRRELSAEFIEAMVECFHTCPNAYGRINLDPMGGQIRRNAVLNSCFAHRDERYILSIIGVWPESLKGQGLEEWVKGTYQQLQKWCQPKHRYTNYVHPDALPETYYLDNTARLQELRRKWDPYGTMSGILSRNTNMTFDGSPYI